MSQNIPFLPKNWKVSDNIWCKNLVWKVYICHFWGPNWQATCSESVHLPILRVILIMIKLKEIIWQKKFMSKAGTKRSKNWDSLANCCCMFKGSCLHSGIISSFFSVLKIFIKYDNYSKWPKIIQKWQKWPKVTNKWPKVTSKWPKVTSKWPKVTQKMAKMTNKWPKLTQKRTKSDQ